MRESESGFYMPHFFVPPSEEVSDLIVQCCPSIHVEGPGASTPWGTIHNSYEAWALSEEVRFKGSSGGAVSAIAISLLQAKAVDAVLHVGSHVDDPLLNQLHVSRSPNEIIRNASSRYAPVALFTEIVSILTSTSDSFVFVGKPCDIAAIKNFTSSSPKFENRIKYFIAILCAGMPSMNSTKELIREAGNKSAPINLRYRGNGWPGNFHVEFSDGNVYQKTYSESWGKVLGKSLGLRCKICPDGIGLLADITVGDSWHTKGGYPDFQERPGVSFVLTRTSNGEQITGLASQSKHLSLSKLDNKSLSLIQAYQFQRRQIAGIRIFAVQLGFRIKFKFHNLGLLRMTLFAPKRLLLRNFIGTLSRILFKPRA